MSWLWFAHVPGDVPGEPVASARVSEPDGRPAGAMAVWPAATRPHVPAVKIDARVIDPAGEAAGVSLVLAPPRMRMLFDDLAVQQARRDVLAARPARALSTLLRGDSLFAGALTVEPPGDDPFGRILPAVRLQVGPGLLGRVAPPPGPDIERHGSGAPWPYPSFDG